mgnify:CR=1 FL=1
MGSEMCIRDRFGRGVVGGLVGQQIGIGIEEADRTTLFPFALISGCLLYTSDAADERSSVDLGGRRIIKKKTNEEHIRRGIVRT